MICKDKVAVFVATHNQKIEISENYLVPIHTGAAFSKEELCEYGMIQESIYLRKIRLFAN